jgi:hypothetical protein
MALQHAIADRKSQLLLPPKSDDTEIKNTIYTLMKEWNKARPSPATLSIAVALREEPADM